MDHPHSESFLRRYVFSTDHKTIAKQYLFTGIAMGILGGLLSYVMRMHLSGGGQPVPGFGPVGPGQYNAITTMHGTIMIFWVAMPVLLAALGNFLIPLMVGARDMAFPRLNMLSYWIFLLSTVVLVASFFVPGGAAAGGWTSYPPLSGSAAYSGGQWGQTLWILAVALEFAAFLMGGINFITTVINLRAPGMRLFDLPLMIWMQLGASIIFLFSVGPLIAGAILLLLDRLAGTGFYDPAAGGDPVLFQHLFWFFGHPEVYVILLPAFGVVAEIIPVFSRKPIFGYRMIVYATIITGVLSFIVWAHHQFIAGIDPRLATPFSVTTILISVPVAVTIFAFIATLYRGSIELTTPMLWALGFLAVFLLGGVTGIHLGSAASDIYMHDTYFVVAHFHYAIGPPTVFAFPQDVRSTPERAAGTQPLLAHLRVLQPDVPAHVRDGVHGASAADLHAPVLRGPARPGGAPAPVDRHDRGHRARRLAGPLPRQPRLRAAARSPLRREPVARQHPRVDRSLTASPRQLHEGAGRAPGALRVQRAGSHARLVGPGRGAGDGGTGMRGFEEAEARGQ
jgi:cytochrome c oxidase subunit 1